MKLFFDTEFAGLKKDTDLISIGFITEDLNNYFYAELTDYNKEYIKGDEFIMNEVIGNLVLGKLKENQCRVRDTDNHWCVFAKGDKSYVRNLFIDWLNKLRHDRFEQVQLYSDVCHYDMVLFVDLFGTAFDLPEYITPSCHDINQDIAAYFSITEKEAFDKNRESIINTREFKFLRKHNALHDAEVIARIHNRIC